MKVRASAIGLAVIASAAVLLSALPSGADAPIGTVVGAGVWSTGGRVSTLEMVGLNPQPEPPSRPALVWFTSGASLVRIVLSCSSTPAPRTFVATGKGNNGRWYQVMIVDRGLPGLGPDRARDSVGVAASEHPPNPCDRPPSLFSIAAGDFLVR